MRFRTLCWNVMTIPSLTLQFPIYHSFFSHIFPSFFFLGVFVSSVFLTWRIGSKLLLFSASETGKTMSGLVSVQL